MLHGTADGVVSLHWAKQSVRKMKGDLGCEGLQFKTIEGLAHSVTAAEIDMMASFMKEQLKDE